MKTITGDLLDLAVEGRFDVIVHGCNCFCNMGAGIARLIKQRFPAAYAADLATTKGDRGKLGTFSAAEVHTEGVSFVIVNAYTQYDWRGEGVKADYAAIRSVFAAVREQFAGRRVGYPLIGAGLARGDWTRIAAIIDAEMQGADHTLVTLPTAS
ncbi:macro domain-containing protein [Eleftheria terrae]|uniref:macro domain-containing protein n=1 Tax=Eleftheria terrae TaxID=1597781 RepID=UPI00263A56ED|nr:macro domain-containing protein [Eleftheria terrae]WKB55732.1 macro domain-containing protein [Eleftheria terrae]